jgi:hypothetical protein
MTLNRLQAVRNSPGNLSAFAPKRLLRPYSFSCVRNAMEPNRKPVRITTHESGRHCRLEQSRSTGAR